MTRLWWLVACLALMTSSARGDFTNPNVYIYDSNGNGLTSEAAGTSLRPLDVGFADFTPATQTITAFDAATTTLVGANSQSFYFGTPTTNSAASFAVTGIGTASVQASLLGAGGTMVVEVSMDGGTSWFRPNVLQTATTSYANSFTAPFSVRVNVAGLTNVRVRGITSWAGTATITVRESAQRAGVFLSEGLPTSTNVIGAVKLDDGAGTSVTVGQKAMSASLPVVVASDQSAIPVKAQDGAGNALTSQVNGSQRAIDVGVDVAGVQVDPRAIRPLVNTDVVKAQVQDNAGSGITSTAVSGKQRLDVTLASAGADGAAAPSHSNLSGGVDPAGNQQAFAVDTSGNLDVTQVGGTKATYSAAITDLVAAALATDIFTITGSGTKTVRVTRIEFSGTETTGAVRDIQLIKRSAANSAGTSTTLTAGSFDSTNAAATATVRAYTANPTLGATVALVRSVAYGIPAANLSGPTNPFAWDFGTRPAQLVVLRGTSEVLAVNLNGVTATGSLLNLSIEWTEE